jgi:4-hydroxy-3-methylbut-2-enyl diphosphate reductase
MSATAQKPPLRISLCAPRGFCAGVDRAIQIVERALEKYGAPVYVRLEIVHNRYVVEDLKARGAIFVEELDELPETDQPVIFSAHGVAKAVPEAASARNLFQLDATCPLVTKVHREAEIHHRKGREIVLIGHAGHPEVIGTMGQLPDGAVRLIETADDARRLAPRTPDRLAWITQTTLSVDETAGIIAALREKFPNITSPKSDDICYATTNRQLAVKQLAHECDLVLVIGSKNSSNSNRLVDVTRELGTPSHLIDNAGQVREEWLDGVETVGITSGASAPEELVEALVEFFRERGADDVSELRTVDENVRFMLPKEIRTAFAERG